jgi:hypothetical protein
MEISVSSHSSGQIMSASQLSRPSSFKTTLFSTALEVFRSRHLLSFWPEDSCSSSSDPGPAAAQVGSNNKRATCTSDAAHTGSEWQECNSTRALGLVSGQSDYASALAIAIDKLEVAALLHIAYPGAHWYPHSSLSMG